MKGSTATKFMAFTLVALSLFCFISTTVYAQDKVIKLKYSTFYPPVHKNSVLTEQWCREIEKRTNNRVKITYFAGGVLTPAAQTYDGVVKGITDIGQSVVTYTLGRLPITESINLPLGYSSGYQATKMANALYQKFKAKELDDVKILYFHAHGPGLFSTKKPVLKMEDLKGQRIKCDGVTAKTVEAMGALPVTMPVPETYDALMKGLVDGILLPMEALKGFRLGELVKSTYVNRGAAYSSGQFVAMNKGKWNALPPDIQQIFMKVSEEWIEKQGKQWDELDKEGREFSIAKGLKIVNASPEEVEKAFKRTRPVVEAYAKELNKKGFPGDEIINFCLSFLKNNP